MQTTILCIILIICMIIHIIQHIHYTYFNEHAEKGLAELQEMLKNTQADFIATKREYENIINRLRQENKDLYNNYISESNRNNKLYNELKKLKNDNTSKEI